MRKALWFKCVLPVSLAFFMLAGCSGSEPSSEAEPPPDAPAETAEATTAVPELTTTGDEAPEQVASSEESASLASCEPTRADMLGPFYEPGAPVRDSVDSGYVLSGAVLAAGGCEPIQDAQIEFWLVNAQGVYDDAHRATVPADGVYRFESNSPPAYEGRPPHIHVRVTAPGYQELVTQHYPETGSPEATFDLVLPPA